MIKLLKKKIRGIEDFGASKFIRVGSVYNNEIYIEGVVGKWLIDKFTHIHQNRIAEDIKYRAVKEVDKEIRIFYYMNSDLNRGIVVVEYNRALEEVSNFEKEKKRISALHGIAVGIILKKSFEKPGLVKLSFAEMARNRIEEYNELKHYNKIRIKRLEVEEDKIILDTEWEGKNSEILPLYEIERGVLEIKYGVDLYTFKKPDYFIR